MRTGVKQNRNFYKLGVFAVSRQVGEGLGGGRAARIPHPTKKKTSFNNYQQVLVKVPDPSEPHVQPHIQTHAHHHTHVMYFDRPDIRQYRPPQTAPIPPPSFGGPLGYTGSIVNRCLYLFDNKSSGTC